VVHISGNDNRVAYSNASVNNGPTMFEHMHRILFSEVVSRGLNKQSNGPQEADSEPPNRVRLVTFTIIALVITVGRSN
jgi:hypothetical protein